MRPRPQTRIRVCVLRTYSAIWSDPWASSGRSRRRIGTLQPILDLGYCGDRCGLALGDQRDVEQPAACIAIRCEECCHVRGASEWAIALELLERNPVERVHLLRELLARLRAIAIDASPELNPVHGRRSRVEARLGGDRLDRVREALGRAPHTE